jgi:hypothetical protein
MASWSSSYASLGFGFELQTLCFLLSMDSSRGRLRNQVVSSLIWLWWVIDLVRFEFESETFWLFYLYLYFMWRIMFAYLVVCRWQVRHGRQRWELWQELKTWWGGPGMGKHRLGTRWLDDLEVGVTLCPVYTMHKEMRSTCFLVEPQNQGQQFVSGLASKPIGWISWFRLQNQQLRFGDLGLKT